MSDKFFTAKKKHHNKRVDIYSIPGTSEVIFHDEPNKKKQIYKSSNYSQSNTNWSLGDILFFFIVLIIFIAIILYFLNKR